MISCGNAYDNPFLYVRTGLLAKLLVYSEIYKEIVNIPGNILEIGCWYGQSSIIFENLRAIYEPFNFTRRIVSFDTFSGYNEVTGLNIAKEEVDKYKVGNGWLGDLAEIQAAHKIVNRSHTDFLNVPGDITLTLPNFLERVKEPVSLVYFDIATYDTLKVAFDLLSPRITKGGIFVLDDYGTQYQGVHKYIIENDLHKKYSITHAEKYKNKVLIHF
jgi:predicted O-methyltransferase YrrM